MAKTTKKEKVVWDEVKSVEPAKTTKKPTVAKDAEDTKGEVPFGSLSELQKVIVAYRKHFKENAPEKNGQATAPNATPYNYYLSSDVFEHADEFVSKQGCILDMHNHVDGGQNIMQLVLEHAQSGEKKVVEANLGNPNSMGDFGARITYAPKYLLAIMFGISVQTDTDAFNNGQVKTTGQPMPVTTPTDPQQALQKDEAAKKETEIKLNPAKAVPTSTEPSKSFLTAQAYINNVSLPEMLDQAQTKVNNSTQMSESEKESLTKLITERKAQLSK